MCPSHRRPWLREVDRLRAARIGLRDRQRREKLQEQADKAFRHFGICGNDEIDECLARFEAKRERAHSAVVVVIGSAL